MSIKKYTNFESIDANVSNKGEFLEVNDKFIINQNQIQDTDFGDCRHDVMEISVYDVNNNLLPNKSGNNVAYIKTGDIKNYLYNIVNNAGQKELAIDIEKLLNDLGFTNGILKVNINFVRNKVGSENELTKVWIQEISPSREEIRILPLVVKDELITEKTSNEFTNINNLSKDFKYYKKNILDTLDSFESNYLDSITNLMVNRFGKDFESVLRKDFGLSNFDGFKKRIFSDFKTSITHWVNNREYDVSQSNYGKPSSIRFEDCEQYDFKVLLNEIQNILRNCIEQNTKTLKRRDITIKALPKEFEITTLKKQVEDLVGNVSIKEERVRNVYNPKNVTLDVKGINPPKEIVVPIELPASPIQKIEPEPIKIIEPPIEPQTTPISDIIPTPSYGGSSGGGGGMGYIDRDYRPGGSFDLSDMNQRENIQ